MGNVPSRSCRAACSAAIAAAERARSTMLRSASVRAPNGSGYATRCRSGSFGQGELRLDRVDHLGMLGETAVPIHRMHQLALYGDIKRAFIPGHQLDCGELMIEGLHQRLRERQGL